MESSHPHDGAAFSSTPIPDGPPPPPPNPSLDHGVIPRMTSPDPHAPSPPAADDAWDVSTVAPETAMKLLCRAVQALASATGDVPPTPPISRPATPRSTITGSENRRRSISRPATPISSADIKAPTFKPVELGSPEACLSEPSARDVGADAEPVHVQQEAIARKFYSKRPPAVSLEQYLHRLQRYCPMSTAVYLAAGVYIYKLALEDRLVSLTVRTVHRLVLATLRVAMKALEDLRYPQARFAGVGGVSENELKMLEISVCYLTDFELQVNKEMLYEKTVGLQQAAQQASAMRARLSPSFQPRLSLPPRNAASEPIASA